MKFPLAIMLLGLWDELEVRFSKGSKAHVLRCYEIRKRDSMHVRQGRPSIFD